MSKSIINHVVNIFYIDMRITQPAMLPPAASRVMADTGQPRDDREIGPAGGGSGRGEGASQFSMGRSSVRKLLPAAAIAVLGFTSACQKTGEGQYEIQKPVIGTQTDTVETPSLETGTVKDTITVPKVTTEKEEVKLPKVEVKTPEERRQEGQQ